jgi:hypothetical protein
MALSVESVQLLFFFCNQTLENGKSHVSNLIIFREFHEIDLLNDWLLRTGLHNPIIQPVADIDFIRVAP